jgi:hypothetical protein
MTRIIGLVLSENVSVGSRLGEMNDASETGGRKNHKPESRHRDQVAECGSAIENSGDSRAAAD